MKNTKKSFELVEFTAVKLTLSCGEFQKKVSVLWKKDSFKVELGEQSHLTISEYLNSEITYRKDINFLINAFIYSLPAVQTIEGFMIDSERSAWNLIPRASYRVRLIYRNTFGLDIRFLGYNMITIQDAAVPESQKTARSEGSAQRFLQLEEMTTFQKYLEQLEKVINASGQSIQVMVNPYGLVMTTQSVERHFKQVLQLFYRYLHTSYLSYKLSRLDLKAEICAIKVDITADFTELRMDVEPKQEGEQLVVPIQALQRLVQKNNLESMTTFIKMLKMPTNAFKQVIPILTSVVSNGICQLTFELTRSNRTQIPFEHNAESSEVCFRVAFERLPTEKMINFDKIIVPCEKIISMGLRYNYHTGLFSIWEPAPPEIVDLFNSANNSVPRDVSNRLLMVLGKILAKLK